MHAHLTSYGDVKFKSIRNYILSLPKYIIADSFWACSHEAGYALAGRHVFEKRGRILNNAIQLEDFAFSRFTREQYREALGISEGFVVGHVGHFSQQKNHAFLLNVFKSVLEKRANAWLVLVGDGTLREEIKRQSRDLGIDDKVLFVGVRNDVNNTQCL